MTGEPREITGFLYEIGLLKRYARSEYQLSTKFTPQAAGSGDDPQDIPSARAAYRRFAPL